ncbi:MAG: pseudouridine synthase [Pseudomonadales bacterium]|nr:pseudouridine synthase [Pseudomonadales bacterium]
MIYLLFNKPFNVLCQFTDKQGRNTLKDYIKEPGIYPAGRLDFDSEGLVILTNNGRLQHKIAHPENKMSKTYWVQVEGRPSEADLKPIASGILLKDGLTQPAKCRLITPPYLLTPRDPPIRVRKNIPDSWLELTLSEGRNRQVRRMCAAIGFPALRLIRYRIGSWTLDGLAPGTYHISRH